MLPPGNLSRPSCGAVRSSGPRGPEREPFGRGFRVGGHEGPDELRRDRPAPGAPFPVNAVSADARWRLSADRLEVVPCPLCQAPSYETLATTDRYDMGLVTVGCRRCGLVYTNPQPRAQALDDFYEHAYRALYQGVDVPTVDYIRQHRKHERALATAEFLAPAAALRAGQAVLDVGAAEGSILRALGLRVPGLRLTAVEPNRAFGAFAREQSGCEVFASLADLAKESRFDLIVVNHVLEHVKHPVALLKELGGRLAPGGRIYVDVPDIERYRTLRCLHIAHLVHLSERTLRLLVQVAGFEPQLVQRHEPSLHPRSIRTLIAPRAGGEPDIAFRRDGWAAVARLQRRAWRFHLKRKLRRLRDLSVRR